MGNFETPPVAVEDDLAERLLRLREQVGYSYADLSKRMAEAGVAIDRSSLQKIEKGEPRRRITVNELVAFGQVYGISVNEILGVRARSSDDRPFDYALADAVNAAEQLVKAQGSILAAEHRLTDLCIDPERGADRLARLTARLDDENITPSVRQIIRAVVNAANLRRVDDALDDPAHHQVTRRGRE